MSLNGLDSPAAQEAYQVALAEAGGWLLLKYTSRDSVDLLGSGKGGVHEARNAIAQYEEASPLYGLIIYRRRKVVIKFVPEGTSRVLLARTAVHFQDVTEKYAPYETLLEIKNAEGLNDTSLAASFKLHTATPSGSSSRLDEISEDAEEAGGAHATPSTYAPTGSSFASQRSRMERRAENRLRSERSPAKSGDYTKDFRRPTSPLSTSSPLASPGKTSVSQFLVRDDSGQPSITSLGTTTSMASMASIADYSDSEVSTKNTESATSLVEPPKSPPRMKSLPTEPSIQSSQLHNPTESASEISNSDAVTPREVGSVADAPVEQRPAQERTSVSERLQDDFDPYDFSQFEAKPKVRLGPRPVTAKENTKRPSISAVPSTYRPTSKRQEQARPKSQGPTTVPALIARENLPRPPPIPDIPEYTPRPLSRGSIKSLPSHKSTAMTPDKIRLMKAVELRKKQLRKSNPQAGSFTPPPTEDVPEVPKLPEVSKVEEHENRQEPQIPVRDPKLAITLQMASVLQEERAPSKKADSGIEMGYDKVDTPDGQRELEQPHRSQDGEPQVDAGPPTEQDSIQTKDLEPAPMSPDVSPVSAEAPQEPLLDPDNLTFEFPAEKELPSPPPEISPRSDTLPLTSPKGEPTSVPTIVMGDGSRPLSSSEHQHDAISPVEPDEEARSGQSSNRSSIELPIPEKNPRRQNSDLARRRRGLVEPLQIDDNASVSDEEFMEELQSATVHNATPITVARSPITQYFQRQPSATSAMSDVSASSLREVNIINRPSAPSLENTDAVDGASRDLTQDGDEDSPVVTPGGRTDPMGSMKRSVSSGISKRIQALAEQSSREPTQQGSRPMSPETAIVSGMPREHGPISQPRSRTSSFRTKARHSARMSSYQNQMAASASRPATNAPVYSVQRDATTNRDSVSVSARIVRPTLVDQADLATGTDEELQQPQMSMYPQRGTPPQTGVPQLHRIDTNSRYNHENRESVSSKGVSPITTRASKDMHRSFPSVSQMSSHNVSSPTADDFPVPPAPTPRSALPAPSNLTLQNDENAAPKESSRTSRFLKRMSNLGSKRKGGAPQSHNAPSPISEQGSFMGNHASPPSKEKLDMPPPVVVGDLNIQFPDSLLWKRRIVEIDDTGCVAFSVAQAMEHQRSVTKKFQLQEFKMPYVPDLDRQELPNSIMLDFNDGTTLQIACEDTMTHRQVVHVLKSYWKAWTAV